MNSENKIPVCVFDTNILVSAIQFDKLPLDLVDLAVDRYIQLVLSEKITKIKEDDADNRILECAVAGKASFVVSGDTRHLLPLKKFQGIEILTPREFMEKIIIIDPTA